MQTNHRIKFLWCVAASTLAVDRAAAVQLRIANISAGAETTATNARLNVGQAVIGIAANASVATHSGVIPTLVVSRPPGLPPEPPLPAPDGILRNRVVAFATASGDASASTLGLATAVRITFLSLPSPYHVWNGRQLWVNDPVDVCELAGAGPGQPCPPPSTTTRFAELDCTPHCRSDWSALGTINTHHKGIVPGGLYRLQSIYCNDDMGDEGRYSSPRDVTTTRWGDCCGSFVGGTWPPPDGRVDITVDVTAVLEKFSNRTTAAQKARTDVEPAGLDLKINISDVTRVLDAFRSIPFPFAPDADPCAME